MNSEVNITPNDLVAYYGEDGGYQSAGYLISSVFDGGKLPPIVTINGQSVKGAASLQTGGKKKKDKLSDELRGLALPLALVTLGSAVGNKFNKDDKDRDDKVFDLLPFDEVSEGMEGGKKRNNENVSVISHSIYDRLLELVEEEKKKDKKVRKTKKKNDKKNDKKSKKVRKTRKN